MGATNTKRNARQDWIDWIKGYGVGKFYDAFVRTAQGAASRCTNCREAIFLDIVEGGGVPDWRTAGGDYGCSESPDTVNEGPDAGAGAHTPARQP
jgi:hypothetical protein